MSRIMSPWELAYTKLKEHYSKDQIDDMLWCEIEELLIREERDAEERRRLRDEEDNRILKEEYKKKIIREYKQKIKAKKKRKKQ